jgi:uracil-DNA glycosylase family protein
MASGRSRKPPEGDPASELIPPRPTLPSVRRAAQDCHACELWAKGTQTVFGEGSKGARLMLIGEQPGDQEDKIGRPFVGPAGKLLDRALEASGIDRSDVYVTNVVKHFNWEPRGKWRIHKKPRPQHIAACRPWLDIEFALVRPQAVVCLGATAAQALLGPAFRVTQHRGEFIQSTLAPIVLATVHPSSLLRAPDDETRHRATERFVDDLRLVARALSKTKASQSEN